MQSCLQHRRCGPTQRHWKALASTRTDEAEKIEGLVPARAWGFKSPLRHSRRTWSEAVWSMSTALKDLFDELDQPSWVSASLWPQAGLAT